MNCRRWISAFAVTLLLFLLLLCRVEREARGVWHVITPVISVVGLRDSWKGQVLPELTAGLYLIRVRCEQVQDLVDEAPASTITPGEIATVLETISQIMVSEEIKELAGHNVSWYKDATAIVEQLI